MAFAVPSTAVLNELMAPDFDPCRPTAVEIKQCLRENSMFNEPCRYLFNKMNNCCDSWRRRSDSCLRYERVFPSSITGRKRK